MLAIACFCCMPIDLANCPKFIRLPGGGIAYFDHPGYGDIFARQSDPVSDAGGVDDFNRDSGLWICAIS